jgi:hypothetical protein
MGIKKGEMASVMETESIASSPPQARSSNDSASDARLVTHYVCGAAKRQARPEKTELDRKTKIEINSESPTIQEDRRRRFYIRKSRRIFIFIFFLHFSEAPLRTHTNATPIDPWAMAPHRRGRLHSRASNQFSNVIPPLSLLFFLLSECRLHV